MIYTFLDAQCWHPLLDSGWGAPRDGTLSQPEYPKKRGLLPPYEVVTYPYETTFAAGTREPLHPSVDPCFEAHESVFGEERLSKATPTSLAQTPHPAPGNPGTENR